MIKVQATIKGDVLEQKLIGYKSKVEKETGMRISWAQFWNRVIGDWIKEQDSNETSV